MSNAIEVETRQAFGRRRKGTTYRAEGTLDGVPYCVEGQPNAKTVRAKVREVVAFGKANPKITALDYVLEPSSTEVEAFALVSPHGGSYIFGAASLDAAIDKLAGEYDADHPVQAFVEIARIVQANR